MLYGSQQISLSIGIVGWFLKWESSLCMLIAQCKSMQRFPKRSHVTDSGLMRNEAAIRLSIHLAGSHIGRIQFENGWATMA